MFEITPEEYLFKARKDTCFFVIHRTDTPGDGKDGNYIMGALFLRHFYSVFDFDKNELSLGINTHSKGAVHMYAPGSHPTGIDNSLAEGKHIDSLEEYNDFMEKQKSEGIFDMDKFMK